MLVTAAQLMRQVPMVKDNSGEFDRLLVAAPGCSLCASQLAHGVRPVLQAAPTSQILIACQAPGARVNASSPLMMPVVIA